MGDSQAVTGGGGGGQSGGDSGRGIGVTRGGAVGWEGIQAVTGGGVTPITAAGILYKAAVTLEQRVFSAAAGSKRETSRGEGHSRE